METTMDPNAGNNESVNDGIFAEIATKNHETYSKQGTPEKSNTDPAATGKIGGGTPTKTKTPKTNTDEVDDDEEAEGDNAAGLDTQDFSRQPVPSIEQDAETDETTDPSQTNTETQTEADATVADTWKTNLPPDPGEFTVEPPKPDEFGQIDPIDYTNYLESKILHRQKTEAYNDKVISATFDTVEKVLPEIKDNPAFQAAIRNTFYNTLSGDETVALAKELRSTIDKVAGVNKAAGVQSAKTSITIQKNAAVETKGATHKKADTSKADNLTKRLKSNDTSAFEELMGNWLEDGKV